MIFNKQTDFLSTWRKLNNHIKWNKRKIILKILSFYFLINQQKPLYIKAFKVKKSLYIYIYILREETIFLSIWFKILLLDFFSSLTEINFSLTYK